MERLTELFGFKAMYLMYPLLAVICAGIARYVIHHYLMKWAKRTESSIDDRVVGHLDAAVLPLLLLTVLYFFIPWLPLSAIALGWIQKGLLVVLAGLAALFLAKVAGLLLEGLLTRYGKWERILPPLRNLANVILALVWIAVGLRILDVSMTDAGDRLIRVAGIIVGAFVVLRILNLAVMHVERLVQDEDETTLSEAEKRAKTIGKIVNSAGFVLVLGVSVMMILSEFGMNIAPIITGAGIAGLAVGFGAQNLVRDLISGFFLIFEDQVRVGDVAVINSTGGLVEAINLRTLVLRDLQGTVHIFPNGEIRQVSNMTKEFSYYVIDVGVAYKEDVDSVMRVLQRIGEDLAGDPSFAPKILDKLEILGVDDFGESQITIKVRIKTMPLQQWTVGRELRRRIKNTFDREGIEIPFPHVSVYFGEASKPFHLAVQELAQKRNGQDLRP